MSSTREIPMFPLGIALMPGTVLPLYLFEPRYLKMYEDLRDGDRHFGVVLIERGSEGAKDNRTFGFGCIAELLGSGLHDDGSISIVSAAKERFRVLEWKESDPYPKAVVEVLPEDQPSESGRRELSAAMDRLPALFGLLAELDPDLRGEPPSFSDDPATAIYQVAEVAGLQPLDLQRVLEAANADVRAALVRQMLEDRIEMVELQLGGS